MAMLGSDALGNRDQNVELVDAQDRVQRVFRRPLQ
jgi:hypothetical protein